MKRILFLVVFSFILLQLQAQCSICTKTASQMGEGPARGLNAGIIYLMSMPLALIAFIGIRWWRRERKISKADNQH